MTDIAICVFGEASVGKSSIINQFVQGEFVSDSDSNSNIEDEFHKRIVVDGKPVSLTIIDPTENENFASVSELEIIRGIGFVIVYAITKKDSIQKVTEIHQKIATVKGKDHVSVVICGNKSDLEKEREISIKEGENLAKELNVIFYETSAKENWNIENSFRSLVREIQKTENMLTTTVNINEIPPNGEADCQVCNLL